MENVRKEKLKEIQNSITRNKELKSKVERSEKEVNIKKEVIVSLENERKLIEQTDSLSGLISLYRNIEKRENDLKESVSAKNRLEINLGEYNGKSELLRKEIEAKKGEYDLFVHDEPLFLEKLKESRQLETEIKGVLSAIAQLYFFFFSFIPLFFLFFFFFSSYSIFFLFFLFFISSSFFFFLFF